MKEGRATAHDIRGEVGVVVVYVEQTHSGRLMAEGQVPEAGTGEQRPDPHRSPIWRQTALTRADRIGQLLHALGQRGAPLRDAAFAEREVLHRLARARWLASAPTRIRDRWSGSQIEACWAELRLAEEALVQLVGPNRLLGLAEEALNHARAYLPAGDARVEHLQASVRAWRDTDRPDEEALRAAIVPVLAAGHEASDRSHQNLRAYQNLVRLLTIVLVVLAALLSAVALALGEGIAGLLVAPETVAPGWSVVLALLAGAIGALFSAIPSLAQIPESNAPFNPVREQAGLKVAVGAWSGVVGLLAVSSALTSGPADATTLPGFLIVAALFGANQEALTRFADHKASALRRASES
jgi:hypothetical protein